MKNLVINHIAYIGDNGAMFADVKNASHDALVSEAHKIITSNPQSTAQLIQHLNAMHVASSPVANPECFSFKNPGEVTWLAKIIAQILAAAVADSRHLVPIFAAAEVLICSTELAFPPAVEPLPDGDFEVVFFDRSGKKIDF